ncbi:MAG: cytochrome c [Deltaproteobacteria bacterium]|nr:cytochrome c [Deltaproteobacteria bacterium]
MVDLKKGARWALLGLGVAGVAYASPWDIDMIDGVNFKPYEWAMRPQPPGVVARLSLAEPKARAPGYYQNGEVGSVNRANLDATNALANPYAADPNLVATGTRLFKVNCAPCHGLAGEDAGPVTVNDKAAGINRFLMAAPAIAGDNTRVDTLSDGYLYATIRNGGAGSAGASAERPAFQAAIGAGMPAYGPLLTDYERWSIVAYMRTLPGASYTPPAPPAEALPTENP